MLRLTSGDPLDTLWDGLLPDSLRELPEDLAGVDRWLDDPALLLPFRRRWAQLHEAPPQGRPTVPMVTYLRIMVLKHRYGWGYETLIQEVSDSLHLRRFCRIPLVQIVPHESTVRKLTRRLGPELVADLIRGLFDRPFERNASVPGLCAPTLR